MLHMNLNIVRRLLWEYICLGAFENTRFLSASDQNFSFFFFLSPKWMNIKHRLVSCFKFLSIQHLKTCPSWLMQALFRRGRLVSLMNWCRSVHKLTLPHAICNYRNAFTHFSLVTVIMELQVLKNSSTVRVLFLFTINHQNLTYDPLWSSVTWTNSPVRVKMCNYTLTVQISVFAQFFYCGKKKEMREISQRNSLGFGSKHENSPKSKI